MEKAEIVTERRSSTTSIAWSLLSGRAGKVRPNPALEAGGRSASAVPPVHTKGIMKKQILKFFGAGFIAFGLPTYPPQAQAPFVDPLPSATYIGPQVLVSVAAQRRLNVFCIGRGKPVVLLDAGAGFDMLLWRHVQGRVALRTRVCAYDRAGYGFSDGSDEPLDARNAARDIHSLITSDLIQGPVVYGGHSIAGLYAVEVMATHPEDFVGAVLVDPAFVGQFQSMTAAFSRASRARLLTAFAKHLSELRQCLILAQNGALEHSLRKEARNCVSSRDYPEALSAGLRRAITKQNAQPKVQAALLSEYFSLLPQTTMATVNDKEIGSRAISFGDMPLLILSHGDSKPLLPETTGSDTITSTVAWRNGHARLARTSTQGKVVRIPRTGHFIPLDDPRGVAAAITEVVAQIRSKSTR
jgi:pimeloyl-ACP methyl ester carboxylesterase